MMSKVIVITGGSDGLGKAIAESLNKDNKIIILSNNEEKLNKVAEKLNCDYELCDVTSNQDVERSIKNIIDKHSKIDILINNAGVWLAGDPTENSYEEINNCIDVNTKGPIYMTKAVLPYMYEKEQGMILNVCSESSFQLDDFSSVYNATKWAMRGFNLSMQPPLSKKNIKLIGFYPGFMQTDLFKKADNDYDTSTGLEVDKVASTVKYIVDLADSDIIIPEIRIKDIENY